MQKLLQNKAAVACLAVIAALCVAGNFVKWPAGATLLAAARTRPEAEPAMANPADYPIRVSSRVGAILGDWLEQHEPTGPNRDPFSPLHKVPTAPTNAVEAVTASPPPPLFVVQAISIDAGRAFAVVNRRVLSVGEQIEGYVVQEILPSRVRLTGPAGTLSVPIRGIAQLEQKSSSGK